MTAREFAQLVYDYLTLDPLAFGAAHGCGTWPECVAMIRQEAVKQGAVARPEEE